MKLKWIMFYLVNQKAENSQLKKGDIISSGIYFTKEYVMILSVCTLDSVKLYEAKTEKKSKSSISVRNFNINPSANELSKLKPAYM